MVVYQHSPKQALTTPLPSTNIKDADISFSDFSSKTSTLISRFRRTSATSKLPQLKDHANTTLNAIVSITFGLRGRRHPQQSLQLKRRVRQHQVGHKGLSKSKTDRYEQGELAVEEQVLTFGPVKMLPKELAAAKASGK